MAQPEGPPSAGPVPRRPWAPLFSLALLSLCLPLPSAAPLNGRLPASRQLPASSPPPPSVPPPPSGSPPSGPPLANPPAPPAPPLTVSRVFAFGDHLLDVGSTRFLRRPLISAATGPYGQLLQAPPAINHSGRFCDGRLTLDFIMDRLQWPYLPPFLSSNSSRQRGVSFATAGAGALLKTHLGQTVPLPQQVQQFWRLVQAERKKQPGASFARSLFLLSAGTNDYITLLKAPRPALLGIVTTVTDAIVSTVKELHAISNSSKFVVFDLPTLGCLPFYRRLNASFGCNSQASLVGAMHNQVLAAKLSALQQSIPGVVLLRLSGIFDDFVYSPKSTRFPSNSQPCCQAYLPRLKSFVGCGRVRTIAGKKVFGLPCANASQFAFWDAIDPTEAVNEFITFVLWGTAGLYVKPVSLQTLVTT